MEKKLYLRASSLPSYQDCARRAIIPALRRQLEDMGYTFRRTRSGVGQCIGTACHAAAAFALNEKITATATGGNLVDFAISTYDAEVAEGVEMDNSTNNKNEAYKQIDVLTRSFCNEILPAVDPAEVEAEVEAEVPQEYRAGAVIITGHIDLVTVDGGVEDWKFGSVHRSHHSQLGMYSLLKKSPTKKTPAAIVSHLPRVKVSQSYPGATRYPLDVAACERAAKSVLMQMIRDVSEFEKTQDPWAFPCNPGSMMCSEKYCQAKGSEWCEITK